MRPVSLKHLLAKPALLIAAGLVLLGATSGRAGPLGESPAADAERSCRSARPSFDSLCRCLTASLTSEDDGGFAHVGLHAAFDLSSDGMAVAVAERVAWTRDPGGAPKTRLQVCRVGPSPPR